MLNSTS